VTLTFQWSGAPAPFMWGTAAALFRSSIRYVPDVIGRRAGTPPLRGALASVKGAVDDLGAIAGSLTELFGGA